MAGCGSGSRKKGKYLPQAIYTHHEWHLQALTHYYYLCVVATMDYSTLKPHNLPVIPTTPQLTALLAARQFGVVAPGNLLKARAK